MGNITKFSASSLFISSITSECVSERLADCYMLEIFILFKALKKDQISGAFFRPDKIVHICALIHVF